MGTEIALVGGDVEVEELHLQRAALIVSNVELTNLVISANRQSEWIGSGQEI